MNLKDKFDKAVGEISVEDTIKKLQQQLRQIHDLILNDTTPDSDANRERKRKYMEILAEIDKLKLKENEN